MQFNAHSILQYASVLLLAGKVQASAIPVEVTAASQAPAVVPEGAVPVFEGSGAELAAAGMVKRDGKYEWAVVLGLYSDWNCGGAQRDNTKPDGTCYALGDNDRSMKLFWLAQGCRVIIKDINGCGGGGGEFHNTLNECIPLHNLWYYQVYC